MRFALGPCHQDLVLYPPPRSKGISSRQRAGGMKSAGWITLLCCAHVSRLGKLRPLGWTHEEGRGCSLSRQTPPNRPRLRRESNAAAAAFELGSRSLKPPSGRRGKQPRDTEEPLGEIQAPTRRRRRRTEPRTPTGPPSENVSCYRHVPAPREGSLLPDGEAAARGADVGSAPPPTAAQLCGGAGRSRGTHASRPGRREGSG